MYIRVTRDEGVVSCVKKVVTAVFKKVVGTHLFFALFGPIGARFSPPPLRQPHGIKVSHIAKLNRAVP